MTDDTLTVREALQINKAIEVMQLLNKNPRMTQEQACANVGITPPTYRKWIATQEEALVTFEEAMQELERVEYSRFLIVKNSITDKLISDALKNDVSLSERIKALEYIEKRLDDLSNRYHTVNIEVEQGLLSGPDQEYGVSKSMDRVNVSVESGEVVVRVKDSPTIIDMKSQTL